MPDNLDNRKKKVLQAIIEEYIDTAEPVSSGNLVNQLDCSSATIRNEMAELEKIGFLEKPHTSAGRIPSQKGYRFYVDELLREDSLSKKEMEIIKERLETKVNDLEDLAKIATTTLSEITHYTTITIEPDVNSHIITDIKFVLLGNRMMMAVILTDSGIIRESIIKFDEDIEQEQIDDLSFIFKNKLVGKPLEKVNVPLEEFIAEEMKTGINIIKKIIEEINKILEESQKVYLEGVNKVVDMPEFRKSDIAKEFLNALDAKDLVVDVLNTGIAQDINVYIGEETAKEELKNFSIVTFNHILEDKDIGTIGIIGPTRMDYSKVISVMKYISKKLNDDFKKGKF
ncbi:MAG: heat-inducible transcription repressor HrcA [Clostridia bacterium]|jgi:heat-inducible transcriptional repressor|nr:heat-inducible transcription repressor HrcA [Clostridia bacterium]